MIVEKENLLEAMHKSVMETMEEIVFTEAIPCEPREIDPSEDPGFNATIEILRPLTGRMVLFMPKELLGLISYEIFDGELEPDAADTSADRRAAAEREGSASSHQVLKDAVGEFLNTIVGRFMDDLTPSDIEFEVGLPHVSEDFPDLTGAEMTHYQVNEHTIILAVWIRNE